MSDPKRPALGFGASGAWALPAVTEAAATEVVCAAIEAGVCDFDTAGFYNKGKAEPRLGRALAEARRRGLLNNRHIAVSTKIGKAITPSGRIIRDFSRDTIELSLNAARGHLNVETLDVVYMHGPNEHELSSSLPHLMALKGEGVLNAIGVCSDGAALAHAAMTDGVDVVMGTYNFLHRQHGEVFRIAKENGKRVAAIAPLAQGLWRRGFEVPKSAADLWYITRALVKNREEWRTAKSAKWIHQVEGFSPVEIAVAFVAANKDIDTIFSTSTRPAHIRETANALSRPLPPEIYQRLGLDV